MKYIDVEWLHSDDDYPIRLVSELDAQRNEVRKLEFFRDGAVGFASANTSKESTTLSAESIPPLSEINAQHEFIGKSVSSEEFEALWVLHVPSI